jgi:hypothetical protein
MAAIDRRLLLSHSFTLGAKSGRFVIESIAFPIGVLAVADPRVALWMLGFVIVVGVVVAALYSLRFAWVLYFSAICANGLLIHGPALMRLEFFALPILGLSVWAQSRRISAAGHRRNADIILGITIFTWLLYAFVTSALNAPESARSLWMACQLGFGVIAAMTVSRVQLSASYMFNSSTCILGVLSMFGIAAYGIRIGFGVDTLLVTQTDITTASNPDNQVRLVGLAFEANIMGSLAVGWLGALYCQHRIQGIPRGFLRLATGAIMIAAVLSGTRAAWVAILVMAAMALISSTKRSPALATIAGLAITAAVLIGQYFALSGSASGQTGWIWRATHILDESGGTGLYRLNIVRMAMADIGSDRHSLLWGTGMNSFSQFHQLDATGVNTPYLSSLWVELLYDMGLFGLTLFILAVLMVFKRVPRLAAAAPMFAALAICASVTNLIWFAYPWVFVALLLKMRQSSHDEIKHSRNNAIQSDQFARSVRQD